LASPTFSQLGFKHLLATSVLAAPVGALRAKMRMLKGVRHPELALLMGEDGYVDAVMHRKIGRDWNCLDVGAHLGSVYYRLQQIAPDGNHAMVEASPGKAAMLRQRFGPDRVHEVAVSDRSGETSFFENLDQPGFSSLAQRNSRGRIVERRVKAVRLDDLLGPSAHFDFIKIDVEGFEFAALQGGAQVLRRCRPLIQFEAGAVDDPDLDNDAAAALYDWLTADMGYDVYAAFDLHFNRPAISADQFRSYRNYPFLAFNYFAVPSDQPNG
jgi:FkbM family methyltransferase